MPLYIKSVENLINEFRKLPAIGPKSARRIVYYLLKLPSGHIENFARSLTEMKEKVKFCIHCRNLSEDEVCHICRDQSRDRTKICIVEEVGDIILIEKTGQYHGLYHVLGGLLSPIENIGPDELRIPKLIERVKENSATEVIIALNPTVEGDSTAMYIKKQLTSRRVIITMLASGLPVGGDLEYADEITIGRALSDRRQI